MIPESFVERYSGKVVTMFGVPVEELSRDELIASLHMMLEERDAALAENRRRLDFMLSMRK